jgi:hypothetical protein
VPIHRGFTHIFYAPFHFQDDEDSFSTFGSTYLSTNSTWKTCSSHIKTNIPRTLVVSMIFSEGAGKQVLRTLRGSGKNWAINLGRIQGDQKRKLDKAKYDRGRTADIIVRPKVLAYGDTSSVCLRMSSSLTCVQDGCRKCREASRRRLTTRYERRNGAVHAHELMKLT